MGYGTGQFCVRLFLVDVSTPFQISWNDFLLPVSSFTTILNQVEIGTVKLCVNRPPDRDTKVDVWLGGK